MSGQHKMEGVLDGVSDREIFGWVREPGNSSQLGAITINSDTGVRLDWKATQYRGDVCRAVGEEGVYGFYIPRSILKNYGRKFIITCADGTPLGNSQEICQDNFQYDEYNFAEECKIYLHIQKSGGTSINQVIHNRINPSEFLQIYPRFGLSLMQFVNLPLIQKRCLRLIVGHTYFGIDKYLGKKCEYVTTLRDPMARFKSQVLHVLNNVGSLVDVDGIKVPVEEVATHGLTEEFDNLSVRMIAGLSSSEVPLGFVNTDHARLAMHNIASRFGFVNILERSQESNFLQYLGFEKMEIPNANVTDLSVTTKYSEVLNRIDWGVVEDRLSPSQALYNFSMKSKGII